MTVRKQNKLAEEESRKNVREKRTTRGTVNAFKTYSTPSDRQNRRRLHLEKLDLLREVIVESIV